MGDEEELTAEYRAAIEIIRDWRRNYNPADPGATHGLAYRIASAIRREREACRARASDAWVAAKSDYADPVARAMLKAIVKEHEHGG